MEDIVCLSTGQKANLFSDQNKENVYFEGKVWAGLLAALFKRLRFPTFGITQLCYKHAVCV